MYQFEHVYLQIEIEHELLVFTNLKTNFLTLYGFMHGHAHSSRDTGQCARPEVPLCTFVKVRKLSRSLRYTGLSLAKLRDTIFMVLIRGKVLAYRFALTAQKVS